MPPLTKSKRLLLLSSPSTSLDLDRKGPERTLLTLPPELTKMIVHAVEPRSLLAVRLTCRNLSIHATEPFGEAFFRTRHQVLSIHSLKMLADITSDKTYGPLVRTVKIGSSRLATNVTLALPHDNAVQHYTMITEQNDLTRTASGPQLLAITLQNIRAHGHTVNWGVWYDADLHASRGFFKMERLLLPSNVVGMFAGTLAGTITEMEPMEWKDEAMGSTRQLANPPLPTHLNKYFTVDSRPFAVMHLILGATHLATLPMRSLSLAVQPSNGPFQGHLEPLGQGLTFLTHLTLHAEPNFAGGKLTWAHLQTQENVRNALTSVLVLLRGTISLASLTMSSQSMICFLSLRPEILPPVSPSLHLETLTLRNVTVDSKRLCGFLRLFHRTVRTLVLTRVKVSDKDGIRELLSFLYTSMMLDEWRNKDVSGFGHEKTVGIVLGTGNEGFVLKGRDDIKRRIAKMLDAHPYKPGGDGEGTDGREEGTAYWG